MSQNDAPDFKSGQKNCCNCDNGQFGGGSDDFRCLKYNFLFDYGMPHASHFKCKKWEADKINIFNFPSFTMAKK